MKGRVTNEQVRAHCPPRNLQPSHMDGASSRGNAHLALQPIMHGTDTSHRVVQTPLCGGGHPHTVGTGNLCLYDDLFFV